MDQPNEYVLTLHCPDRPGLVFAVSQWLMEHGCNIVASDQFGDPRSGRFFLRLCFVGEPTLAALRTSFEPVARDCSMTWGLWPADARPKVLVLVSKYEHCLADLLHRARVGDLPIEIVLVVSNDPDAGYLATAFDVDFLHLPVNQNNKAMQERKMLGEARNRGVDFVGLARYILLNGARTVVFR